MRESVDMRRMNMMPAAAPNFIEVFALLALFASFAFFVGGASGCSPRSAAGTGQGSTPVPAVPAGDDPPLKLYQADGGDGGGLGDLPDAAGRPYGDDDSAAGQCSDAVGDFTPCSNVNEYDGVDSDADADGGLVPCLSIATCSGLMAMLVPLAAGNAMSCLASNAGCAPDDTATCVVSAAAETCEAAAAAAGWCTQLGSACGSVDGGQAADIVAACNVIAPGFTPTGATAYLACAELTCTLDGFNACAGTIVQ